MSCFTWSLNTGLTVHRATLSIHDEHENLDLIKTEEEKDSTQLSMKFILLINVKMPTIVGIITFTSRINDWLL